MSNKKQSLKTLFDTYWSSAGWKRDHITEPKAFEEAVANGVMFHPQTDSHSELLRRIFFLRDQITPHMVGTAFISSLSSKVVESRSALGSYAVAKNMTNHSFTDCGHNRCAVCGSDESNTNRDLNVLNFERHKWGGVRHTQLAYIALDLELFLEQSITKPTDTDWSIFKQIVTVIDEAPQEQRLSDLVKGLSKVIPGNKAQRETTLSILGFAGVLNIPEHTGFFREFTNYVDRTETSWHKDDWDYPVRWWLGGNGINPAAIDYWFPQNK